MTETTTTPAPLRVTTGGPIYELVDGPQVVKARERAVAAEEAAATLRSGIDGLKIQRDPATGRANADRYGVRYIPYTPK
mgnify:FL=1